MLPKRLRPRERGDYDEPKDGLRKLLSDPVSFSRGVLGQHLWWKQERILRDVQDHGRVVVKACHSSGKTFHSAALALWWLLRHPDGIVITTAPTWSQVEKLLWGEIKTAISGMRVPLAIPEPKKTEINLGPRNYLLGLSTNEGVRFQGFHGTLLFVLDEAPGVRPDIWEAIEGARAGGKVAVLAQGNPMVGGGPFMDAFRGKGSSTWKRHTISALHTPNLQPLGNTDAERLERLLQLDDTELDADPLPYLTRRRWVREKYFEWGPGHPLWDAKVLGRFPGQAENSMYHLSWIHAAKFREVAIPDDAPWRAGLDVAGPGKDETSLCVRHGGQVIEHRSWARPDPRQEVLDALEPYREKGIDVLCDADGIGWYMARHIEDHGFRVTNVRVGTPSSDPERFVNLKAELYWNLRLLMEREQIGGLTDDVAAGQLATVLYDHDEKGRIRVESKSSLKTRGEKSPDRGEAVILAFAESAILPIGPVNLDHELSII